MTTTFPFTAAVFESAEHPFDGDATISWPSMLRLACVANGWLNA
jgi:hypothetical protein